MEQDLLALEHRADPATINRLFRAMHSIKGGAGFLGLPAIAAVAHRAEALLDQFRAGHQHPDRSTIDALLAAADRLRHLTEYGWSDANADVQALCDRLDHLLTPPEAPTPPPPGDGRFVALTGPTPWAAEIQVPEHRLAACDDQHPLLMALRFDGRRPLESSITTSLLTSGELLLLQPLPETGWLAVLATPMPADILCGLFHRPANQVVELARR
jgi:HPt (histidine-containing phosphotransfer) domain-containing protein